MNRNNLFLRRIQLCRDRVEEAEEAVVAAEDLVAEAEASAEAQEVAMAEALAGITIIITDITVGTGEDVTITEEAAALAYY